MFCSYCGVKANDGEFYCRACGKPLDIFPEEEAVSSSENYAPSYDEPDTSFENSTASYDESASLYGEGMTSYEDMTPSNVEPSTSYETSTASGKKMDFVKMQPLFNDFVDRASETASKAVDQAKTIASQTKDRMEKNSDKELEKAIKKNESKNKQKEGLVSNNYMGTNYMSTSELWTWLKKDSKRQQFYTNGGYEESEDEYIEDLREKISNNSIPAKIEKRKICWDRSDAVEQVYVVVPETKVVNPLTYLVQFCHVGDFTFVEEKTFITPPDLPERPGEKLTIPKGIAMLMLYIAAAAIICFLLSGFIRYEASSFILVSIFLIGLDIFIWYRYRKIFEYNKKCDEQLKKWNEAWDNWKKSIFLHSFQEDINGQLSRIFDSVYSSINQLNDEKFGDKKVLDVQDASGMNEMEELISRKREEYR